MSHRVAAFTRDAVAASTLPATARAVAITIATYANADGRAWPGSQRLAEVLGVSVDTIYRARRRLIAAGILTVTQRPGRVTLYQLPVIRPVEIVHNPPRQRGGSDVATPRASAGDPPRQCNKPPAPARGEVFRTYIERAPDPECGICAGEGITPLAVDEHGDPAPGTAWDLCPCRTTRRVS